MKNQKEWLRHRFPELVALFAAGGLFLTGGELLLMGHTEGVQLLAPLTAIVGGAAAGLGLVAPRFRLATALVLGLMAGVGFLGLFEHLEKRLNEGLAPGTYLLVDAEEEGAGGNERGEGKGVPPPLAPLSLTGLTLLGALALYVRDE
ncbi:hypothetical protein [Thermus sp.]|uniref:hypothetical protein n=1 Tax=Thermus sp. TaxID=275 RepID=UPI003D0E0FF8